MKAAKPAQIPVSAIRMDGGTQSRAALSQDAIDDYAAAYAAKAPMPPVVVFFDKGTTTNWLADGFHRCYGAQQAGVKTIPAEVRAGTLRDAKLYSAGANADHGLRRTNADKRHAVEMLLLDPEWAAKSDRWIATATGVNDKTVAVYRAEVQVRNSAPGKRKGQDGKSYPAEALPAAPSPVSAPIADPPGYQEWVEGCESTPAAQAEIAAEQEAGGDTDDEAEPPIDMLGLTASPDYLAAVDKVGDHLTMLDHSLRVAQARLSDISREGLPFHASHIQDLRKALHEVAARVRQVFPAAACPICRDPDGTGGRRKDCGVCLGEGYIVESQRAGIDPKVLAGEAPVLKPVPLARAPKVAPAERPKPKLARLAIEINGKAMSAEEVLALDTEVPPSSDDDEPWGAP